MSVRKADIRKALRGRLTSLSLPDVNWEGLIFTPESDTYLQETLITDNERVQVNNERRSTGSYLLEVFDRIDNNDGEGIAETIKNHFSVGLHLNGVTITRSMVGQAEARPPWMVIPVQIDWRAFEIVWPSNVVLFGGVRVTYNGNFVTHA